MKNPNRPPEKQTNNAISMAALLALILSGCAGTSGTIKNAESLQDENDVLAFIHAAAARNDIHAVMQGKRTQFAIQSDLSPDAYPYNGLQDDGRVIECAQAQSSGFARRLASGKARRVFMEAHRNPEIREIIKKMTGGTLRTKIVHGDASGIDIRQSARSTRMKGGAYVNCALAKEAFAARERKEQKSGTRGAKGDR